MQNWNSIQIQPRLAFSQSLLYLRLSIFMYAHSTASPFHQNRLFDLKSIVFKPTFQSEAIVFKPFSFSNQSEGRDGRPQWSGLHRERKLLQGMCLTTEPAPYTDRDIEAIILKGSN